MDDDCERGQYKAHHAIIALIDYGAIELKNSSKKYSISWLRKQFSCSLWEIYIDL